jgi:hypothetical protein
MTQAGWLVSALAAAVVLAAGPRPLHAALTEPAQQESVVHRLGDWFATLGKPDAEKATIKAERRAKREARRLERQAEQQAREAERTVERTGDELKEELNEANR